MDAEIKQQLGMVVTSIINNDVQSASNAFHTYLNLKTQDLLSVTSVKLLSQTDI